MREVDRLSTTQCGIPSAILMENAGFQLYLELARSCRDLAKRRVAIMCGKGNNGGDGMVLARQLRMRGVKPDVYLLARCSEISGDAGLNLGILLESGCQVQEATTVEEWRAVAALLGQYQVLVDAILGTGLTKPLDGLYLQVVRDINRSDAFVLAVDIPSGMASDSTRGDRETIEADCTVTFTAPKVAHILNERQAAIGRLVIAPIGSPDRLLERPEHFLHLITPELVRSFLVPRPAAVHKGDLGHVALAAGSRGKGGAAALCSRAALRTGSGLVTALVPDAVQLLVASFQPEIMTEALPSTPDGTFAPEAADLLLDHLKSKDAAGMGPGLTIHSGTVGFVHEVVSKSTTPLVIDADALNAFQGRVDALRNLHCQPLVLTPHPGEFSRLTGLTTAEILDRNVESARAFAQERGVWLVLKGFRTLVAAPDGQVFACPRGNPGMATAGMGDVLTGVLTSLLGSYSARGWTSPEQITRAVVLGVYLHALAGDLAAGRTGAEALNAGDVVDRLGEAYRKLAERGGDQDCDYGDLPLRR
jgi:NAD(P)H-hydrate epimerase